MDKMTLAEKIERAIRDAIDRIPECRTVSELDYCNAVIEGCETHLEGIRMRRDELEDEIEE